MDSKTIIGWTHSSNSTRGVELKDCEPYLKDENWQPSDPHQTKETIAKAFKEQKKK